MKKSIVLSIITILVSVGLFAQDPGATDPTQSSVANPRLKWIVLDRFEDDGFWQADMPRDHGFATLRRFEGSPITDDGFYPAWDSAVAYEEQIGVTEQDNFVLGVKLEYLRRAVTQFSIKPSRPIPIPGITKQIAAFVVGRNIKHRMYVIVQDFFGNRAKLFMDELKHSGWNMLTASIISDPRNPHLMQKDPHYSDREGIFITEFIVELDPLETYGSYYFYIDKLFAQTDLFAVDARDEDDMPDFW
jgi:hypothetical protein